MGAASGCSGRDGSGMSIAEGLRVAPWRTFIYSFIIYVNLTLHYFVPGNIPDIGVMTVSKADEFLAFRELSWKHMNVWGRQWRQEQQAIGHICYWEKKTGVMNGICIGKSCSMEMKSLLEGERETVMWRFRGRVFQVKGSAVAAVLMQDYS